MTREVDAKKTIRDDWGDAHAYYTTLYPAGEGFRLMVRLVRLAGGAAGRVWGAFGAGDIPDKLKELSTVLDSGIDGAGLAEALERLTTQILDEGGDDFARAILKHVTRDGQRVSEVFDLVYSGNYGEMLEAVVWALGVNFGPFLRKRLGGYIAGIASRLEGLSKKTDSTSEPPRETSG